MQPRPRLARRWRATVTMSLRCVASAAGQRLNRGAKPIASLRLVTAEGRVQPDDPAGSGPAQHRSGHRPAPAIPPPQTPACLQTRYASERSPLLFLQLAGNAFLLELRKILDEDFAFQMIHFVLDANREQPATFDLEGFAVEAERLHPDPFRTGYFFENAWYRQATFLAIRLPS